MQTEMSFGETLALWHERERISRVPEIENVKAEEEVLDENAEIVSCDTGENETDEDSDVDVSLTPGEREARHMQAAARDEQGFYDCNPDDIELCPVETRERRYRLKRGITADSGAGDPVIPRRMVNSKRIRPSAGSRRGLHYVSATDHRIPNVGEIKLEFRTDDGVDDSIVFQVADVNKPLMSLSDRVDKNYRIVFDRDDETGDDLSNIFNKKTKEKMKLRRVGKVWVLPCTVAKDFIAEDSSVFSRQGK